MKRLKRYLCSFLAISMLVGCIDIGIATDEKVSKNMELSSEKELNSENRIEDEGNSLSQNIENETSKMKTESSLKTKTLENESTILEEDSESETDNWELGLVFYDSTVDSGTTPLTEINWDASNGGYETGESRVITVQINYRNTNCVKTYQPGELEISIPNLSYNTYKNEDNYPNWDVSVIAGANDNTHIGYDWNFITGDYPHFGQEIYKFQNANIIESKSNFEGSIQIVYNITSRYESPEQYDDRCEHSYTKSLIATLNNITNSNEISLTYYRKYIHPWKRKEYPVTKTAYKISSYDGFGENADDYIWVKYGLKHTNNFGSTYYPYINAKNGFYKDKIPKECIVYDENMNLLTSDENGYYSIVASYYDVITYVFIGYPKSIYNEANNNLNITNEVELWGTYYDKTKPELLDTNFINLNLANYEFIYTGNLYGISKSGSGTLYQQDIQRNLTNNKSSWGLNPTAIYTGNPMTVKIGDDLLFATSIDGSYIKLEDDEYHFEQIKFNADYFKNGNNQTIQANKYDCELWIRYKDTDEYVWYESFKNPEKYKTWTFTKEDGVVSFYFMIYDMNESIYSSNLINANTRFNKQDIPESGKLYNFCYLQVYFRNENGNLILQNEPELGSYSTFMTQSDIATFDLSTYGTYMQRSYSNYSWNYFDVNTFAATFQANKYTSSIIQDVTNEKFKGKYTIENKIETSYFNLNYKDDIDSDRAIKGFKIFDLLPKGMELASSKEEIRKSLNIFFNYATVYNLNFEELTKDEIKEITNTNIIITDNWHNTGRIKIEIIAEFTNPIYVHGKYYYSYISFKYSYNYNISYDSFLEYGKNWTNSCYIAKLDKQEKGVSLKNKVTDNGKYDKDVIDIDDDGDITDEFSYNRISSTITSVISTHQDVQKSVQTDRSNFSTGTVETSLDSEYEYKLRARTGQNDVTNFIIYDSLEEYALTPEGEFISAYGDKEHWKGEFLGIDTSYAESKGCIIKTYYSENTQAGNLYDEEHILNPDWKEYDGSSTNIYEYGEPETITSPNWPNNYPNSMTEANNYWEVSRPGAESLEITFDATCQLESASYDYLRFYDRNGNNITASICGISADKIGGKDLVGKTYTIPGDYVKITMRTDGSGQYKGFSAEIKPKIVTDTIYATDRFKVKSLAFEYLDADGNPAIIPANSLTYVLIKMKSPTDENIKSYAYNGCRTQWQALDEFNQPVDFITGINSNIVKVALPNSEEAYGSYLVKHEYYVRDYKGDLILENTISEELVSNIPIDTVIKAEDQNHLSTNNNKQYTYTEDTGDITIEKDITKEIIIKYIREQEYGSYIIKHEYYVKDFNNNLTQENTYSEEVISNIPVYTIIKAEDQNHIETNNNKQYKYTEDTGDITIQKDITQEIIIKYVRDEEYTTELPETGSTDSINNLIYVIFFLLLGSTSLIIATKKKILNK